MASQSPGLAAFRLRPGQVIGHAEFGRLGVKLTSNAQAAESGISRRAGPVAGSFADPQKASRGMNGIV